MLLAWGLTLLPPFVDMLAARAHDAKIGYLELGDTPWSTVFIRFFDPTYTARRNDVGIRVETAVACLLGAAYALLRARNARILRAAAAVAGVYVTSLFVFTAPFLFLRALGLFFPGLTLEGLYGGQGMVPRPASVDVRTDQGGADLPGAASRSRSAPRRSASPGPRSCRRSLRAIATLRGLDVGRRLLARRLGGVADPRRGPAPGDARPVRLPGRWAPAPLR